jgi:predicted O-methyltransferase YrrM
MAGLRGALGRSRRQALALAREARHLRALPPRVAGFYVRAWLTALRTRDRFTLDSATRPSDVARLLSLARGHLATVELGTGTAWTTIALALADPGRRVVSYDPEVRSQRERYLRLIGFGDRARIELRTGSAEDVEPAPDSVGFLFVDCSHDRETTAAAFTAWRPAMAPGGVVVFHDYDHPRYPGVREAVEQLGLRGTSSRGVFIWRAGGRTG